LVLSGGLINIETNNTLVNILGEKRKSTLKGLSADEFPIVPIDTQGEHLTINSEIFANH